MTITVAFNGGKLRAMREDRGMSRRDLAAAADVAVVALQKYELGGNASPGVQSVGRIAIALGCMIEDFLDAEMTAEHRTVSVDGRQHIV